MEYRRNTLTVAEIKILNKMVTSRKSNKEIEDSLYLKPGLISNFMTEETCKEIKKISELKDYETARLNEALKRFKQATKPKKDSSLELK